MENYSFFELRKRAEALLADIKPTSHLQGVAGAQLDEEICAMLHQIDTYRIELVLQNEELLHTQKTLQDSLDEYINLYYYAPVGYCSLDSDGFISKANNTLTEMLDIPKKSMLNQKFSSYIMPEDQDIFYLSWQKFLNYHVPCCCEVRLRKKNHDSIWVKLTGTHHNDIMMLAVTDISCLKKPC